MQVSPAMKVERYMVLIDNHDCFIDVTNGYVVAVAIPELLRNSIRCGYTYEEVFDGVLMALIKTGYTLNPNQKCMERINKRRDECEEADNGS